MYYARDEPIAEAAETKLVTGRNATAAKAKSSKVVVSTAQLKVTSVVAPIKAKVQIPVQVSTTASVAEVAPKVETTSTRFDPPVVRTTRSSPTPVTTSQAPTTTPPPPPPPSRTTTTTTTSSPPPTSSRAAESTESPSSSLKSLALSSHNDFCASHDASPLTWSSSLATAAQTWANNCVFEHSGGSLGPFGENLAVRPCVRS